LAPRERRAAKNSQKTNYLDGATEIVVTPANPPNYLLLRIPVERQREGQRHGKSIAGAVAGQYLRFAANGRPATP